MQITLPATNNERARRRYAFAEARRLGPNVVEKLNNPLLQEWWIDFLNSPPVYPWNEESIAVPHTIGGSFCLQIVGVAIGHGGDLARVDFS